MKTSHKIVAGLLGTTSLLGGGAVVADQQIDPYDSVQVVENGKSVTKLEIASESSLPEGGEVKNIVSTDEPKITLSKWNGEVALGVKSLDLPANTSGARPFLSKNVEWNSGNVKMEAVPLDATTTMEDGGLEINIILNSQPASNVFTFQLDNWQNLDFFYQPELNKENRPGLECSANQCLNSVGRVVLNRGEDVTGSYAVYYKDHANHRLGSTNYATGKAYHIYRPLVTDAKGATTWADLSYSNGMLTVTVPQSFLDNANYPVKVDPTFGNTNIGATDAGPLGSSFMYCSKGTPVNGNGTVDSASVYQSYVTSAPNEKVVLTDSGHTILTNGVSPSAAVAATTFQWDTINYVSKPSVTNSTLYYICFIFDNGANWRGKIDSLANNGWFDSTNSFTTPTSPTDGSTQTYLISLYATYTAAATTANTPTMNVQGQIDARGQVLIK